MLGRDWFGVLVFFKGFVYLARHVAINVSLNVIPGELYSAKKRTRHVNGHSVIFLQCINEVGHVVHVGNFYAKVIYH
jgi:hypothetical protein